MRYLIIRVVFFFLIFIPTLSYADITVDVTKGNTDPLSIAMPDFQAHTSREQKLGADILNVVIHNLKRSGLFAPVQKKVFADIHQDINKRPHLFAWKEHDVDVLLTGKVILDEEGQLRVLFRLWNLFQGKEMLGFSLDSPQKQWRRIAHRMSDMIYQRLTGEKGYFNTRIVFISESGNKVNRKKRLTIMDQDGANKHYLTSGDFLVLTPRFSPSSQQITYISYETGIPQIFLYNLKTGRREVLGQFSGMTFSPRFSPNGQTICMTLERNGNSDIYLLDLRSRKLTRLTTHPSIDTSPSFSPDGKNIVFNSDRGGTPQLYVMDLQGDNIERISFGTGRYLTPVWSPRGDLIAYTKNHNKKFYIGVLKPDGSGTEKLLTEAFFVEGPTWSPNGRVILFTQETPGKQGHSQIWSINITGKNLLQVNTHGGASDPAWSPLMD